MSASCTLDDLERLLDVIRTHPELALGPRDQIGRIESFLVTAIDTRIAQKRQRPTAHQEQLMEAYRAAVAKWELDRENYSNGYPAEAAEFTRRNPRPTYKEFLLQHQRQHQSATTTCPSCGAVIGSDGLLVDSTGGRAAA